MVSVGARWVTNAPTPPENIGEVTLALLVLALIGFVVHRLIR